MDEIRFDRRHRLGADTYANAALVFHVVMRAVPGKSPFRDGLGASLWDTLMEERDRTSVWLVAACLMPDHLHVIVRARERSIVQWVGSFKSYTTCLARAGQRRQHLWQPGFYDRVIREGEFTDTLAYVLSNPGGAGLQPDDERGPWVWSESVEPT